MINNNYFEIEKLENVVFIGFHERFDELIQINDKLGIKTEIITSSDQSKKISNKIKFKIFDSFNEEFASYIEKKIPNKKNTLFFSLQSRTIFNKEKIEFFINNLVNLHESRLPYDAGGAVYSWQILREDRIAGITVHLIEKGIDSGPIIFSKRMLYPPSCIKPIDYKNFIDKNFLIFYEEFLSKLINKNKLPLVYQSKYIGRYNPRLNDDQSGWINWDHDSHDLINFINAFDDPYKGASTLISNKKFKRLFIKKAQLHGGESQNHPYMQGLIVRHDKDWIVVATKGKHTVVIEQILDENNKNVISELREGDRFFTTQDILEKNKSERIIYTSKGRK